MKPTVPKFHYPLFILRPQSSSSNWTLTVGHTEPMPYLLPYTASSPRASSYSIGVPLRLSPVIPFSETIATLLPQTPQDAGRSLVCWYLFAIQPSLDIFISDYIPTGFGPFMDGRHPLNTARILVSAVVATIRPWLETIAEGYFHLNHNIAGVPRLRYTPTPTMTPTKSFDSATPVPSKGPKVYRLRTTTDSFLLSALQPCILVCICLSLVSLVCILVVNKGTTRRALVLSSISILLCFCLLITGTRLDSA